jgi:hypothetical protein
MPYYAAIGSILHAVNLVNIAVYGSTLYLYGNDPSMGVFDKEWLQDGFCLPHGDRPYLTTHDVSGYAMVLFALTGLGIQQYLSRKGSKEQGRKLRRADRLTFWALVGAIGHAAGHFLIANGKRMNIYPPPDERFIDDLRNSTFLVALGKAGPGYPLFWIPLVKTYMMNTTQNRVAVIALLANILALFMPAKFGFSYTQAVLFGGMSIDQLILPAKEKDTFEFALWPLLTTIPNGIFSWVECLTCTTNPLMQQHGHLVYDLYMVSSYTLFYLVCWNRQQKRNEFPKQKAL